MLYQSLFRPVVLVEIPCIFLMYFFIYFLPKYAELALTSTILCIKFNVFLCCFEPSPDNKKINRITQINYQRRWRK